jgi:RES domain-containing protein
MLLYRICDSTYSLDISGKGAARNGGRWNPIDKPMLYASEHASLCALEIVVHAHQAIFNIDYDLIVLYVPDVKNILDVDEEIIGPNWQKDLQRTQNFGLSFLSSERLLASVPSVIVPEERNYLINPNHHLFSRIQIVSKRSFAFDERLR